MNRLPSFGERFQNILLRGKVNLTEKSLCAAGIRCKRVDLADYDSLSARLRTGNNNFSQVIKARDRFLSGLHHRASIKPPTDFRKREQI